MTQILPCNCANQFQDKRYGRGMRVMNPTKRKSGDTPFYRCTNCLKEQVGRSTRR